MLHHRIGRLVTGSFLGLLLGSAGTLAAGSPALAQTASPAQTSGTAPATIASCQYTSDTVHSYSYCSTGQSATITVPPSGNVVYTFNYPGDNSNITFTASVTPIDPTTASAIGVNVFDNTKPSTPPTPAEIVTIQTNELNSDPHMMQFNYSSGTAGPVTLQLFNYSSGTVTFSLNDSGLVFQTGSGAAVTPVTLQLKSGATSAPAGSAPVSPGASPAPGQPTAQASGDPSSIQSCQYTSDQFHSYPFCSTGQFTPVNVPANGSVVYKFNYPGDNSDITFTAQISPITPATTSAIGFNVFDNTKPATPPVPVEIATVQTNEVNSDPHALQFNYSSGTSGPVTVQLFNYSPGAVTISLNDSGLILPTGNGTQVTPITLQLA